MMMVKDEEHTRLKIKEKLNEGVGLENTLLNKKYKRKIINKLLTKNRDKWATYNQLVVELNKRGLQKLKKECQYKLTDTEYGSAKKICLKILNRVRQNDEELNRLYHKISNF